MYNFIPYKMIFFYYIERKGRHMFFRKNFGFANMYRE